MKVVQRAGFDNWYEKQLKCIDFSLSEKEIFNWNLHVLCCFQFSHINFNKVTLYEDGNFFKGGGGDTDI